VGKDVVMSLSRLHSLMVKVRCVASMGGRMNLRSSTWEKLMHELEVSSVISLYLFGVNC
jgi:hypothetical protein